MAQMMGNSGQGGGMFDMLESLPMGAGGGMGLFKSRPPQTQSYQGLAQLKSPTYHLQAGQANQTGK